MRHPIFLGIFIVLWVTPVMTLDRFLLAFALSVFLLMGNRVDQEDIKYVEDQLGQGMQKYITGPSASRIKN